MMFDVEGVGSSARGPAAYVAAALHAVAREERRGRWPQRLIEPGRGTWKAFRGRLDDRAFVQLLIEDAAVTHPHPFRRDALFEQEPVDAVPADLTRRWMDATLQLQLELSSMDYVQAQAKLLGVPFRFARSELPVVQAHHHVLELPGTGGQIMHHVVSTQPTLSIRDNFVIACKNREELVLAGLVATELGASGELPILLDPDLSTARASTRPFDFVFGVTEDKGGPLSKERLLEIFPTSRVVLV